MKTETFSVGPGVRAAVFLTATVMVLSLVPASLASPGQHGTIVGSSTSDNDLTGHLLLTPGGTLSFNDADGSGGYNCPTSSTCDPIYLDVGGTGAVAVGDLRLSHASLTEGRQVKTTDSDAGNALGAIGGGFAFEDIHPSASCPGGGPPCDGSYNIGEPLYIDVDGSGTVSAGDVKIVRESSSQNSTGSSSFTMITGSDSRAGNALTALAGHQLAAFDTNGDGAYNNGDAVFLDVNADNMNTPGDVQLSPVGSSTTNVGSPTEVGDSLAVHVLNGFGAGFAWNDADTDGNVDDNEVIYIDADGSGTVTRFDVRIGPVSGSSSTSTGAGDQVGAGASDLGNALTGIGSGQLRFRDNNGNAVFDAEDSLYLDIGGSSTTNVETGDLRLHRGSSSSGQPGSRVSAGDSDHNAPLVTPGAAPAMGFVDFNGGVAYALNDAIYLDWDGNGIVTPGDLRVSKGKSPMSSFGEIMTDSKSDANNCFRFNYGAPSLGGVQAAWLDGGNAGTTDLDEGVYLDRANPDTASPLDVRLSPGASKAAGTFVQTGDTDQGKALARFGTAFPVFFHDGNGDGVYSLGTDNTADDAVYLDVTGGGGTTAVGDVRITEPSGSSSDNPGSKVTSGSSDRNLPISAMPGGLTIDGVDRDGDGTFDSSDYLYGNIDAAAEGGLGLLACPTPGDLRLSGSGGASSTTSGGGGGTGGTGGTTTPTANPPSISITNPSDGSYHKTGTSISITGTASGGDDSIDSVTVTVNGAARSVTGLSSWSASFTAGASKDYTIVATVTDDTGESRQTSVTITTTLTGEAPDDGDDGTDGGDETEAERTAREAKETAQQAEQTAQEAKQAAEDARDIGEQNQESLQEILNRLNETDQDGAPGPGVLAVLAAIGLALVVRRRYQG